MALFQILTDKVYWTLDGMPKVYYSITQQFFNIIILHLDVRC